MTGVRLFTKDGMTARKTTVVGMSVALGVGITQVSGCLQGLGTSPGIPEWIRKESRNTCIWKFVRGSGNDHGDHPEPHPSAGRVGQPDDLMQKESRTVFNPVRLLLLFLHLRL